MRYLVFVILYTLSFIASACAVEDQEGWPVIIGEGVHSSPNMADLDGNGTPEVIVAGCAIGQVYVIQQDGTLFPGWPQKTGQWIFSSSPAVGDIDCDGDLEIVIGSDQHRVYAWHHDGTPVRNWPVATNNSARSSPLLGDLDRDGDLEIVIGTNDGRVNAWHHDGKPVDHWPQHTDGSIMTAPACGDLDNDGDLEVVCGSEDGFLYVWHHDGSPCEGWPVELGIFMLSSPILGDVDRDGFLEIVAFSPERGTLYLLNNDGSPCDGWLVRNLNTRHSSSPSLGDLNGDGDLEILIGGDQAYAFHSNGSPVPGWPIPLGTYIVGLGSMKGFSSTIAVGDIDGDGIQEAVVNGADQNAYAFHWNGQSVRGWPVWTDDYGYATPIIGNLDHDPSVELIVGQGGNGSLPGTAPPSMIRGTLTGRNSDTTCEIQAGSDRICTSRTTCLAKPRPFAPGVRVRFIIYVLLEMKTGWYSVQSEGMNIRYTSLILESTVHHELLSMIRTARPFWPRVASHLGRRLLSAGEPHDRHVTSFGFAIDIQRPPVLKRNTISPLRVIVSGLPQAWRLWLEKDLLPSHGTPGMIVRRAITSTMHMILMMYSKEWMLDRITATWSTIS